MNPDDLRMLCAALSFTAMTTRAPSSTPPGADQITRFAGLIEAFCRHTGPATTHEAQVQTKEVSSIDGTIETIKRDLHTHGSADLHYNRTALLALYDRLHQRYAAYASDAMLADRVLELLDAELTPTGGAMPDA